MSPDQINAILGWLGGREHQHTNSEGISSYNVVLPESLFDALTAHLEGLLNPDDLGKRIQALHDTLPKAKPPASLVEGVMNRNLLCEECTTGEDFES